MSKYSVLVKCLQVYWPTEPQHKDLRAVLQEVIITLQKEEMKDIPASKPGAYNHLDALGGVELKAFVPSKDLTPLRECVEAAMTEVLRDNHLVLGPSSFTDAPTHNPEDYEKLHVEEVPPTLKLTEEEELRHKLFADIDELINISYMHAVRSNLWPMQQADLQALLLRLTKAIRELK